MNIPLSCCAWHSCLTRPETSHTRILKEKPFFYWFSVNRKRQPFEQLPVCFTVGSRSSENTTQATARDTEQGAGGTTPEGGETSTVTLWRGGKNSFGEIWHFAEPQRLSQKTGQGLLWEKPTRSQLRKEKAWIRKKTRSTVYHPEADVKVGPSGCV